MNIKFEMGREHQMDTVESTGNQPKADAPVDAKEEKARLQAILTDAGIEFSKQLGVAKLQELVETIEVDVEE